MRKFLNHTEKKQSYLVRFLYVVLQLHSLQLRIVVHTSLPFAQVYI